MKSRGNFLPDNCGSRVKVLMSFGLLRSQLALAQHVCKLTITFIPSQCVEVQKFQHFYRLPVLSIS